MIAEDALITFAKFINPPVPLGNQGGEEGVLSKKRLLL
jgi:hypothetical protein